MKLKTVFVSFRLFYLKFETFENTFKLPEHFVKLNPFSKSQKVKINKLEKWHCPSLFASVSVCERNLGCVCTKRETDSVCACERERERELKKIKQVKKAKKMFM